MQSIVDSSGRPSFERGALVIPPQSFVGAGTSVGSSVLVTRIVYTYISAVITAIASQESARTVRFNVTGGPSSIEVQSAQEVEGPYVVTTSAEIVEKQQGFYEATILRPFADNFFRIALR